MQVTFHRAFDMTPNAEEALETLIAMGVDRVLTSGQEASVMEGLPLLKKLVTQAKGRIIVMPGAGISERNFAYVHEMVGASEYHVFVPARWSRRCSIGRATSIWADYSGSRSSTSSTPTSNG